jgi:hypothetical protein
MLHHAITWRRHRRWSTSEVVYANNHGQGGRPGHPTRGQTKDQPVLATVVAVSRRQHSAHDHHHDELLRPRRRIAQAKMRVDVQRASGRM